MRENLSSWLSMRPYKNQHAKLQMLARIISLEASFDMLLSNKRIT